MIRQDWLRYWWVHTPDGKKAIGFFQTRANAEARYQRWLEEQI